MSDSFASLHLGKKTNVERICNARTKTMNGLNIYLYLLVVLEQSQPILVVYCHFFCPTWARVQDCCDITDRSSLFEMVENVCDYQDHLEQCPSY